MAPSTYCAIMSAATPAELVTVTRSVSQGSRWSVPEPPTDTQRTASDSTTAWRGKAAVPAKRTEKTTSAAVFSSIAGRSS